MTDERSTLDAKANRILILFAVLITVSAVVNAEVTAAKRGKFAGVVKVEGKTPNATLEVWQSDKVGGSTYVYTGFDIDTNASGNGSVKIPNVSSGRLLKGHNVCVPGGQPCTGNTATVVKSSKWFPSARTGTDFIPDILIAQTVSEQPPQTLVETWEAGAEWTLRLDPAEASWFDAGASISTDGDLSAEIMAINSQEVTVRILSDPTFDTQDDIHITGIGVAILTGITELHTQIGLNGGAACYIGGDFVGTATGLGEFVDADIIDVTVPVTDIPILSRWGLFVMALLLLCMGVRVIVRLQTPQSP